MHIRDILCVLSWHRSATTGEGLLGTSNTASKQEEDNKGRRRRCSYAAGWKVRVRGPRADRWTRRVVFHHLPLRWQVCALKLNHCYSLVDSSKIAHHYEEY